MGECLVLFVDDLPLLLEGSDHLVLLALVHEELLTVHFSLLFNLHFSNKLILVFNFLLDSLQVFGYLSIVLFLEEVFFIIRGQLWSGQNVLDSVRYNEVLVRDESHDWLLVFKGHWNLLSSCSLKLGGFWQLKGSGVLQSEGVGIWLGSTLGESEAGGIGFISVMTSWGFFISSQVCKTWLGGGLQTEGA